LKESLSLKAFGLKIPGQVSMKRYKATVNASGMWVETILYAQNQAQAYKLFQAIFGANNVPHQPLQIG
jgi:glycerol-3-phosphate dehydrogenase